MSFNPQSIALLGRQPAISIAELESLHGADRIVPFGDQACLLDIATDDIDANRLGGTIRVAKILNTLPNDWRAISEYLITHTPEHAKTIEGKLTFGISVFGIKCDKRALAQTALAVKKAIKTSGSSVRMVPHDSLELNAATVLYNKLTGSQGWELLVVSNGTDVYLAQTTAIQDIDAYAARDQKRPYRDAKVGMLPPKLAQIIINLAVGNKSMGRGDIVLDPFCGTGVVLQEATLMDYDVYGTDIEPRMIQYSIDNLAWIDERYPEFGDYRRVEVADATKFSWENTKSIRVVACETYLGQPLSALPASEHLSKIIFEVNLLHHKFFENISKQISSGTRLCVAVPTWRGKHEFLHLPALEHLTEMGYNRLNLKHVRNEDLIYHRENQIVGRELLVLEKQ